MMIHIDKLSPVPGTRLARNIFSPFSEGHCENIAKKIVEHTSTAGPNQTLHFSIGSSPFAAVSPLETGESM